MFLLHGNARGCLRHMLHKTESVDWAEGRWTHEPVEAKVDGDALLVTCVEGSDAWRKTSYGFVHESEHALLAPLATGRAVEVTFLCDFAGQGQFDQAVRLPAAATLKPQGVFLRIDEANWIKAGVESADGLLNAGAVATLGRSDWSLSRASHAMKSSADSLAAVEWAGRRVTVRASRSGDAVTIRARADDDAWRLLRVTPFPEDAEVSAGPFACAPTRAGLTVRFERWAVGPADESLH